MKNKLYSGIPLIKDYEKLLKDNDYLKMENYSKQFLNCNSDKLDYYSKKWCNDPFNWWSRKWEYLFVYSKIMEYTNIDSNYDKINILDAGSGITFFPYFIQSEIKNSNVICCDIDESLEIIFNNINKCSEKPVSFYNSDIGNIPFEDNYFSIIYSISVLEHTQNFEEVIKEFYRLLKPNGMLVITFDISIDGLLDISVEESIELLERLLNYFETTEDFDPLLEVYTLNEHEIVTTKYAYDSNATIKNKFNDLISNVYNKIMRNNVNIPNLTFYCISLKKT